MRMRKLGSELIKSKEDELQETIIKNTVINSRPQVQIAKDEEFLFTSFIGPKRKKKLKVKFQEPLKENAETLRSTEEDNCIQLASKDPLQSVSLKSDTQVPFEGHDLHEVKRIQSHRRLESTTAKDSVPI